jgi:GntP family gluconate:H+ symporter
MSTIALLGIAAASIALLLLLIIRFQVHAFVALMLVSLLVAMVTGIPVGDIIPTLIAGMGGTLGSVAILVALGAMLGRMIEVSGGAAPGQPLHPAAGTTARAGGANGFGPGAVDSRVLRCGLHHPGPHRLRLLQGRRCESGQVWPASGGIMLAVHVVVPPHPGIVGGAAVLGADVGWITLIGLMLCIPLAFLSQFVAGRLNRREFTMLPDTEAQLRSFGNSGEPDAGRKLPSVGAILALILIPLALIMLGTTGATMLPKGDALRNLLSFTGAPLFALMVAIGLAFVLLVRPRAGAARAPTRLWNPPCPQPPP